MKKILLAFIIMVIMAMTTYGADTAMNALTDGSGSIAETWYGIGYNSTTPYRFTIASILNKRIVQAGANNVLTYTGNYTFGITLTGNTSVTFPTSGTLATTAGNVATATALAANGANCSAGQAPLGVDASGAAEGCWAVAASNAAMTVNGQTCTLGSTCTVTASLPSNPAACTAGEYVTDIAADGTLTCSAPSGSGDVTSAGDCASGACYDGSSDGGTYVRLYDGTSAYVGITAGVRTLTFAPSNANAENMVATFGDNNNTVALSSGTGGVVNITGNAATVTVADAADDTTTWPMLATSATGSLAPATDSSLTYNASTGILTATGFATASSDGNNKLTLSNNTSASPTASTNEVYFEANVLKVNQNGTEYSAALGPTGTQINFSGTLTNGRLCTFATGGAISCDTTAGSGDLKADGTVAMTAALVPNAANTIALGSTSAEWADIYFGDGAVIYGQNDQSATLTSSASLWTANNFAATTSLKIPVDGTVDADGEITVDKTTGQFKVYSDSVRVIPSVQWASFVIPAPAATDDIFIMKAPYGMTITGVSCIVQGTTSVTGQLQECGADGTSCADTDSDITCDADGAADDGSFTNASIDANDWILWKTTSVSGTPTFLTVTFKYIVVAD